MKVSDKGRQFIESCEGGPHLKPYNDQTGKEITQYVEGATIGYGHLISKANWDTYKNGITSAQADSLFKNDLEDKAQVVRDNVKVNLTQNQFDALASLAYNIGKSGFADSAVLKLINDPKAKTPYGDLDSTWKAYNQS